MGFSVHLSRSTLRHKILGFVGALVVLTLASSMVSLLRISEVERALDAINRVFIPLGRLLSQIQSDADIFHREMDRRLGFSHWQDPHWKPRPVPKWIEEVLESEFGRARVVLERRDLPWATVLSQENWRKWLEDLTAEFTSLRTEAFNLFVALEKKDEAGAAQIYPKWIASLERWKRQLNWGVAEYEKTIRRSFSGAEARVSELKTALQVILGVVVVLSLLLLWLGERALRPLGELTRLAREITQRGLRKEDKSRLPALSLARHDEVSELSREFHHMATALLEREKTVEQQKACLEDQNRRLREMAALEEKLRQAEHLAAAGRMSAQVAHEVRNPLHAIGLEAELATDSIGKIEDVTLRNSLRGSLQSILTSSERLEKIIENYLRLSRLSAGKKGAVDLAAVLEAVLATYSPQCQAQGVQVEWEMEPTQDSGSSAWVWGDADLLEYALGNLMRNSLQALEGREAAKIKWSLKKKDSRSLCIQVEDNGPGVADAIQLKLFTPFVTSKAQGTGLGLSFVKKVMEDHGGHIRFVNRDFPEGALFEMGLPRFEKEERKDDFQNHFISG